MMYNGEWYGNMTLISLVLVVLVIIWKAMVLLWLRPKKIERLLREQGFKGNPYKPIIGNFIDLIKYAKASLSTPINLSDDHLPRFLGFLHPTIQKYGRNCFMWMGPTPWLIISDHEKIKEVLIKHQDYQKPNNPFTKLLLVGLLGLEGDQWAKHRKIINPAFHLDRLKNNFEAMYESCSGMVNVWEEIVKVEGFTDMDVMPHLVNLTGDVISRAAFGSSYEHGKRIFELQEQLIKLWSGFQVFNYIPGWRFLPTKINRRANQICKEVEELLTRMIELRKSELEKEGRNTKEDLLGILLESNMREMNENGNALMKKGLTTKEVVQECKLFYLAGSETTSSLLVWTLILLSKHRTWQDRARDEVLQLFGNDGKPTFEGLNHLKVVNMIINEVLRLYPSAYLFLRTVPKEKQLQEWLIPAGTEIVLNTCFVYQDCDIWGKDAKEFNPERFSEGVANATKGHGAYFPFSIGPRSCIGQNFALLEAKLALTMILQQFSFDLSPRYTHSPQCILNIQPQYGADLILHKL